MKPRKIEDKFQPELLKIQLIYLLDMNHSLVQLADKFNLTKIDELCSTKFCKDNGNCIAGQNGGWLIATQTDE